MLDVARIKGPPDSRPLEQKQSSYFARHGLTDADAAIAGWCALYVVAFAPFFHFNLWTPRVMLMLATLPFGLRALSRLIRIRDRAAIAAGALLLWALAVGTISDAPFASIVSSNGRWDSVLWWSAAFGMWALGRRLSQRGRVILGAAFLAGCAASGIVGVLQAVVDIDYEPLAPLGKRALGFGVNPVYFGATMAGATAFAVHRYVAGDEHLRPRWLAAVGAGLLFVTLSGSRIALVGGALFVVIGLIRSGIRRGWPLMPGAVAGVAVGTILQRVGGDAESSAADRLTSGGLWPRAQVWNYGWKALLERPFTGYGLGRYRPATQRFYTPGFVREQANDDLVQGWYDPHNYVVQIAVSLGLVGLLLFAWFVISAARRSGGPLLWAAAGIACSWLLQPPSHVTFGLAALLLGASQVEHVEPVHARLRQKLRPGTTVAACAVALALVGWAATADLTVKAVYESGTLADGRRAATWNRFDAPALLTISTAVLDPVAYTEAEAAAVLDWSNRATEYEPGLPLTWAQLGIRQLLFGNEDAAREALERAIELQPYHPLALAVLRTIAQNQGDDELLSLVTRRLDEIDLTGDRSGDGMALQAPSSGVMGAPPGTSGPSLVA
jgi:O-antigen ligase